MTGRQVQKPRTGYQKLLSPIRAGRLPLPPAGPIVVPYPNTAYASTMKEGTTTVFICNSMVAKEDISYFSTSTGDEGATQTQPNGMSAMQLVQRMIRQNLVLKHIGSWMK